MNVTTQRPGTAQSLSLGPRMPFEAAEALLWERQNNRANTHLSAQMKELQEQHDKFSARIQATEAVAEAAEASIHRIKQMDAKIAAIEAEERDRPLDAWTKESIKELQISVDAIKNVRQKLNGLENKMDNIEEQVETARGESAVLKDLVKRLKVLEEDSREEATKVTFLEKELSKLRAVNRYQKVNVNCAVERTHSEVQEDDNPLAVFYGINTQSPPTRRQSPVRCSQSPVEHKGPPTRHPRSSTRREIQAHDRRSTYNQEPPRKTLTGSPQWSRAVLNDLQSSDEELIPAGEDDFHPLETQPEVISSWENTQLYRNMQKEIVALRAMCQTQEAGSSNDTVATQHPQETLIVSKKNNEGFSDATTEPEAEDECTQRNRSRMGILQDSNGLEISDASLFSSPPKRTETQSARRNLMKRPSIRDSRVPPDDQHRQTEHPVMEAHRDLGRTSTKRKGVDDAPMQRVTRPKPAVDKAADRDILPAADRRKNANVETSFLRSDPPAVDYDTPALSSPTCKTYCKQKPTEIRTVQHEAPEASLSVQDTASSSSKPFVPVTKAVNAGKLISKLKLTTKGSAQAATGSSKPPAVKNEGKGLRKPPGACTSCRLRHAACDRTRPVCSRCAKSGATCDYPAVARAARSRVVKPAVSPKKEGKLRKVSADQAGPKDEVRARSVTVSPELPDQKIPARRPKVERSSKPSANAAPTAASFREPRARYTQQSEQKSLQKQK